VSLKDAIQLCLVDPVLFSSHTSHLNLRTYQEKVARAIVHSITHSLGFSIVVMFPRQSGKNELQAQILTYLLTLLQQSQSEIVQISPTWKPQSLNAMHRLERVLENNLLVSSSWHKSSGYIYQVGRSRVTFLSGSPEAHIMGATASTLLSIDEAQDIQISKYDRDIAPMAASTNATRVFWGTAWTNKTLLARERRNALASQEIDGIQRVYVLDADQVAAEVPAYGLFVANQVANMGRNHPMVKSQYYSEEIDAEGTFFSASRIALIKGSHASQVEPVLGHSYAFLVDVAGEDEASDADLRHDATSLTIVEVDLSTLQDELVNKPIYRVIGRQEWLGNNHVSIYHQLKALSDHWDPRFIVIDATGIGAGLASFLDTAFPHKVISFIFSSASKSKLGWDFLGMIETGRFKDYSPRDHLQDKFFNQLEHVIQSVASGPGHLLSWSVPDGTRDPATGDLVHDDLVISAALCTVLDDRSWGRAISEVIAPVDPLDTLSW